jgi:very-short-patch-repair endonuclease
MFTKRICKKDRDLKEAGFEVLRFDDDVLSNIEWVMETIEDWIKKKIASTSVSGGQS